MSVQQRLQDLGVTLPTPAAPVANYVSFVKTGNMLYISGQLPVDNGALIKGCMGMGPSIEEGQAAAKLCAIGLLAQANVALEGDLSKIVRCVKLGVFVASAHDFTDHPKVANGASDFMVAALGDAGRHTRAAVGVSALPLGALVEVDAVFELRA